MYSFLEIDSVSKSFGHRKILTDIYLKCSTGEIIGVFGRNGAGKSTLFKILFGTVPADSKFIRIDGKVYHKPYTSPNCVCYLPQHSFLPQRMTVRKVCRLYLDHEATKTFLDDLLLAHLIDSSIGDISGGELRYLEVKLLLHSDCKFLLLDEPFTGMSPLLKEHIKGQIVEKAKEKGVILTDHDYSNVLSVATRLCVVADGGLKNVRDPLELVKWGYLLNARSST